MSENQRDMVMPVQPMIGSAGYGADFFGGNGAWIILFLFAMMWGGWGGFGMNGGMGGGMSTFPWLLAANQNTAGEVSNGFANQAVLSAINGVQAATQNVGTQLYSNEIASLNRSFDAQTATMQGFNGLQSQLAQCCCDNRLATANLSALVQSENCADREALSNGIRDIITSNNAGVQRILDQMCNDKLDAKNEKIAELQQQLMMKDLAASQVSQTAALVADNTAQTQYIVNRVAPYPIPSYQVANPYGYNSCNCNTGCGCM